jgi:glycosyltransferase involved in cell wall biosynthesis
MQQHDVFAFPDYRAANTYQRLMYDHMDGCFKVVFGGIDEAIDRLGHVGHERGVVFHLHWEDAVYRHATDETAAFQAAQEFLARIESFLGHGGMFLWTMHNWQPHDAPFGALHAPVRDRLLELADVVHVHGPAAVRRLADYGVPPRKIAVVPHGNYCPNYQLPLRPVEASRAALRLPTHGRVFLLSGRLSPYKGADVLLRAFASATISDTLLVVAGRTVFPLADQLAELPRAVANRVIYRPGFVADDELPSLFHAADFVVLPYREVLSSGSLLLAFSLRRPVVAPAFDSLRELVNDGENGILYQPAEPRSLSIALQRAAGLPDDEIAAMGEAAFETARAYDWATSGLCLSGLLHRLIALARPRRRIDPSMQPFCP